MSDVYTTILTVDGMTCHKDEAMIISALRRVPKVKDVHVCRATATVTVTSVRIPAEDALQAAIESLGFRLRDII